MDRGTNCSRLIDAQHGNDKKGARNHRQWLEEDDERCEHVGFLQLL